MSEDVVRAVEGCVVTFGDVARSTHVDYSAAEAVVGCDGLFYLCSWLRWSSYIQGVIGCSCCWVYRSWGRLLMCMVLLADDCMPHAACCMLCTLQVNACTHAAAADSIYLKIL